jgi:hypothetical protein
MTTREIADALNKNKWYEKKDKSLIDPFQIHGRTRNYSQIFIQTGSTISLINQLPSKQSSITKPAKPTKFIKPVTEKLNKGIKDVFSIERTLMDEKYFKNAGKIDKIVPVSQCGLYCIRISDINKLPTPYNKILNERGHNIIYIGIATGCLNKRFLNQELRANGHGTFFRSIGAILGFKPPKGSLIEKSNKRNYKFSKDDNERIIKWINQNLIVNWIEFSGHFDSIETTLIEKYKPLINIAKNPAALKILSELRADCARIANSI